MIIALKYGKAKIKFRNFFIKSKDNNNDVTIINLYLHFIKSFFMFLQVFNIL